MAIFALQLLKNFNASHNGVLTREGLSFELSQADSLKTNGNFYCTAWKGTWVKNVGNGLPTQ